MRVLNTQELQLKKELKGEGILELVDPTKSEPNVLFYCGDCDRAPNAVSYEQSIQQEAGFTPKIHHIAVNGGPLNLVHDHYADVPDFAKVIAGQSPHIRNLLNATVQDFLFRQIRGSHLLKKLRRLKVVGHWPCGQAEDGWRLDFETALHELALATELVRQTLPHFPETEGVVVATGLHLHKPDEMSTYHFSAHRWLASPRAAMLA